MLILGPGAVQAVRCWYGLLGKAKAAEPEPELAEPACRLESPATDPAHAVCESPYPAHAVCGAIVTRRVTDTVRVPDTGLF